jgi:hypothetical protein
MIKRIIMDIDEKLHKRIKDCSIRDDRTLNSTIKKVLSAGIGIVETRVQSYDDGANTNVNIVETVYNKGKGDTDDISSLTDSELHIMYDRTLTSFELNKIRKDHNYKPDKKVIVSDEGQYQEFMTYGKVRF